MEEDDPGAGELRSLLAMTSRLFLWGVGVALRGWTAGSLKHRPPSESNINGRQNDFGVWMSARGDSARGAAASSRSKKAPAVGVDWSSKAAWSIPAPIDSRSYSASSI
jgi:hypothetical protein